MEAITAWTEDTSLGRRGSNCKGGFLFFTFQLLCCLAAPCPHFPQAASPGTQPHCFSLQDCSGVAFLSGGHPGGHREVRRCRDPVADNKVPSRERTGVGGVTARDGRGKPWACSYTSQLPSHRGSSPAPQLPLIPLPATFPLSACQPPHSPPQLWPARIPGLCRVPPFTYLSLIPPDAAPPHTMIHGPLPCSLVS